MAFERIAEQKIREAIEAGEFDNLVGAGKPIDLEEYFQTPEHLRMAYSILKSAGCAPEEIELMKEIAALDAELATTSDGEKRQLIQRRIRERRLQLAIALERARGRR